jgi:hypothetical protein
LDPLASKVAARLQTVWIVRDATPDSTLGDIFWEQPINRLDDYIRGTPPRGWNGEKHTVYTEETEARKDAERRLEKAKKKTAMDNLAGNVASKFAAKSGRTTHLEGKSGHTLCGETSHQDTLVDSVKDATCHYCVQAWEKKHG